MSGRPRDLLAVEMPAIPLALVHGLDQQAAGLRTFAASCGVDLDDERQAYAALFGAVAHQYVLGRLGVPAAADPTDLPPTVLPGACGLAQRYLIDAARDARDRGSRTPP